MTSKNNKIINIFNQIFEEISKGIDSSGSGASIEFDTYEWVEIPQEEKLLVEDYSKKISSLNKLDANFENELNELLYELTQIKGAIIFQDFYTFFEDDAEKSLKHFETATFVLYKNRGTDKSELVDFAYDFKDLFNTITKKDADSYYVFDFDSAGVSWEYKFRKNWKEIREELEFSNHLFFKLWKEYFGKEFLENRKEIFAKLELEN